MEATRKRNIKTGIEFDSLFPKVPGSTSTIRRNANVSHTVAFIPKVVHQTLHHTQKIAGQLKGTTVLETCSNIWRFVYWHIQYKKDEAGYEQVRSPARAWRDRQKGVDCDCYTVFISSILTNLGIPHILRITKYSRDYFQHIYPIVPYKDGKHITIDCVTNQFDFEVPYSEKKDYPMDLQYLNGIDNYSALYVDANDQYLQGSEDELNELNSLIERNLGVAYEDPSLGLFGKKKRKKRQAEAEAAAAADPNAPPPPPKKKKRGFFRKLSLRKVLNVVNRINPATVLLRNGLLVAMKLNVSNVAKRLRWGYLTPQQAAAKNIDLARHQRLVASREKLEKIFEGAGGRVKNLKKAILSGKGNKDRAVQGLDGLDTYDFSELDSMDVYTPLPQLLGKDIYYSENVEGLNGIDLMEGVGELGALISPATLKAAMGVIKAIIASLKQIGNIFKGEGEGSADFDENMNAAAENNQSVPDVTPVPSSVTNPTLPTSAPTPDDTPMEVPDSALPEGLLPLKKQSFNTGNEMTVQSNVATNDSSASAVSTSKTDSSKEKQPGFWDKNKKWIKPVAIAGGGIAILAIGYALFKNKTKNKSSPGTLSGLPRRKKNHHRKKKKAVALL